ncbi:MAG: hypothetical protein WCF83_04670 [Pseudolabrys sp.]
MRGLGCSGFAILAVYQPFFALFIAGILITDLFGRIENQKSRNTAGAILCAIGPLLSFLPETGSRLMYVAAPVSMVAGVALFAPVKRLFENRIGDFPGWISFPLYLVQAAVIYSVFRPRVGRSCGLWIRAIGATVADRCCDCAGRDLFRHPVLSGQRFLRSTVAPLRIGAVRAQPGGQPVYGPQILACVAAFFGINELRSRIS